MIRTQIQLTEEQHRLLRRRAEIEGVSMAELVRRGVDHVLEEPTDRRELYARAWDVIGKFRDREGATDVAENHDRYLEDAWQWESSS